MTVEQINVAIAEACGWHREWTIGGVRVQRWVDDKGVMRGALPNYTTDLNAMHEAMSTLTKVQREHFGGFLYAGRVCSFQDFCTGGMVFGFAHKTAAQFAEAFLRTLGKWVDIVAP